MKKQKKTIKVHDEDVVVKMYCFSIERMDKCGKIWYCDFMISDLIGNPMKEGTIKKPKKFLKKELLRVCEKIINKYLEEKYDSRSS